MQLLATNNCAIKDLTGSGHFPSRNVVLSRIQATFVAAVARNDTLQLQQ
jgi:hypothetical protein